MGWPFEFVNLSSAEKAIRRQTLDRYASYAQLSALVPVLVFLLYKAASCAARVAKKRQALYDAIPNSPSRKSRRLSGFGAWATHGRQLQWWLADDISLFGQSFGRRDQWIGGTLWMLWLALLCVLDTGSDYLHLTKRCGIIAVSQLPVQYLLALKSLNPFAFIFRSSHEHVNRWHRVLGRIIYAILCVHVALYLNYFIQMGTLMRRLIAPIVAFGVVGFFGFSLLSTTALQSIRGYSYRLFFITHLVAALAVPPFIIFHAKASTAFMSEAIIIFLVDLVSRKIDTATSQATIESIPGTALIKISASLPYSKVSRFRDHPGSHIYLNIPAAARLSSNLASRAYLLFEFLYNPFTVAHMDEQNSNLTLVVRHRSGPMTATLARFAGAGKRAGANDSDATFDGTKVPLNLEGPYGIPTNLTQLCSGEYDRILLVAGGVGATFTVPLYRAILKDNPNIKIGMVWAVRGAGDATWAVAGDGARGIMDDENVHVFLTGDVLEARSEARTSNVSARDIGGSTVDATDGEVELSLMHRDRKQNGHNSQHNRRRPNLQKIVDDLFRHNVEERVAVLACGPTPMVKELRDHVGVWVMKGRIVWWHSENFDW